MPTEWEARAFFLEHELVQAYHTISFLRDCIYSLEHPEHLPPSHHAYPEQVERHLRDIEALVEVPMGGCGHAHHNHPDCPSCVASKARWAAARRHAATLGWVTEPGGWPHPPAEEATRRGSH